MIIKENPFYILGASLRDNRQKIMSLAEEKSLEVDEAVCSEARMVLTNPRRRLVAELSWFPGVSLKETSVILSKLKFGVLETELLDKLPPLVRFNLSLELLLHGKKKLSDAALEKSLFELAKSYDDINADSLLKVINEERSISGFSEVSDVAILSEEIENIRIQAVHSLQDLLSGRSLTSLNHIMLGVLAREKKDGSSLELVQDYIDSIYAMSVQKDMETLDEGIKSSIENVKKVAARKNVSKSYLEQVIDEFLSKLEDYDNIMQPMQVSMQNRGLEHTASREMASQVRLLAIHLSTKHKAFDLSERIVKKAKELFAEVNTSAEHFAEDLSAITQLRESKAKREKEITCTIEKRSLFFPKTVSINPKKIQYGETEYQLNEITHIRYGLTERYVNGFHQGTDTMVAFGDSEGETVITWMDKYDFRKFTDALWKAVGPDLIMIMVAQLAQGKDIYGTIYNDGIKLTKSKFFSSETKFFKWHEVGWAEMNGAIHFMAFKENDFVKSFSFQEINNAHVISVMMRIFKDHPARTISEAFGMSKADAKKERQVSFSEDTPEDSDDSTSGNSASTNSVNDESPDGWLGLLLFVFIFIAIIIAMLGGA